jgi:L-threonylcarbamoyladenylate synthase
MKTTPHIGSEQTRAQVVDILEGGGVVVLPTDTLYGLSAVASSPKGLAHIRAIKRSRDERLFIVLASSVDMVSAHVRSFGCVTRERMASVWPAPVTAILPAGEACADWMGETVAVRVPDLPPLIAIIEALGEPIVSTSVNRAGEPPRATFAEVVSEFGAEVDLVVRGDDKRMSAQASTIVDLTGETAVVIREGDYRWPATP